MRKGRLPIRKASCCEGVQLLEGWIFSFAFPHVIAPHWHDSNERVFVAEGQLTFGQEGGDKILKPGGFAFLPAREIQRISCTSEARCTFHLSWDGKPESHAVK